MSVLDQLADPYTQKGLAPGPSNVTSLASVSATAARGAPHPPPWSPDNPLFWFGALLAITFGLVGASTSVKVGPFKAAASAGSTK